MIYHSRANLTLYSDKTKQNLNRKPRFLRVGHMYYNNYNNYIICIDKALVTGHYHDSVKTIIILLTIMIMQYYCQ